MTVLLTVPETAKRLRLSNSLVYQLCQRGELPSIKIGTAVRIAEPELEAWIGRQARKAHGNKGAAA